MFWWKKNRLSVSQLWGLAAGGPLARLNRASFTQIRLHYDRDAMRNGLKQAWGIESASGLSSVQEWLLHEGHRKRCIELCVLLQEERPPENGLVRFVSKHLDQLQRSQLHGFDLGRLAMLARFSLAAEYIDETEAWTWIMGASVKLQENLDSWKELGDDFILGCEFLRLSGGYNITDKAFEALLWLTQSRRSPWNRLPWQASLDY